MTRLPESEGPMREWLRQTTYASSLVSDRVYFAVPEKDRPTLPFIVFYRVGGLPDDFAYDNPDFIFECWGIHKHEASTLATDLASDIMESNEKPPVVVNGGVVIAGTVNSILPTGAVSWAKRYRVDASFRMRAT